MRFGKYGLPIGKRTLIMGVLNVTPDSFSDGGEFQNPENAARHAVSMVKEGADIIDIGGESTRPGAKKITPEEEINRIKDVLEILIKKVDVPISIDTYKSQVAEYALSRGASIVNDISALRADNDMAKVVAKYGAGVVLMHIKGAPETMQENPHYEDLIGEIYGYLDSSIHIAVRAGIDEEKIIVDPGIGFGKTFEHNLTILRELSRFKKLGKPILVGTSRKSFLGKLLNKDVKDRLYGTLASSAIAIVNGADIIRVHDVGQMKDVATVVDILKR